MTRLPYRRQREPSNEEGYVLIAVIFLIAILTLSLAVALPKVRQEIQREREIETIHRGKEYARAIKLYYRKFGAYPTSIDALVMTNDVRYLRRRYTDPITGKNDWKPIFLGQNRAPTAMGFFGEPLGSVGTSASAGSSGETRQGSGDANPWADGTTDTVSDGDETSQAGLIDSEQTYGGGPIIGFSPASPTQSILIYKKMRHYDEWEFVYDPRVDRLGGGLQPGAPSAPNPPYSGTPGSGPATSGVNSGASSSSAAASSQ